MVECIAPNEIESWQLDAYRDGVRDPEVVKHIQNCPTCAQKVAAPDPIDARLTAALFRSNCPTVDDLMNYEWGLLPEAQAAAVAEHLTDCSHCAREAAQLAPPLSEQEASTQAKPSVSERLRVFVARLLPAGPSLAPAPVRGEMDEQEITRGPATAPQCYQVDELDWDITLSRLPGPGAAFTLQGQLLGPSLEEMTAIQAELIDSDIVVELGPDGVFVFASIPPGRYTLCLRAPQIEIQIPDIELV